MNVLRTPVFRNICRTEVIITFLMLLAPVSLLVIQFGLGMDLIAVMPAGAVLTSLRMLMIFSLANHLSEAAAASAHFYHAKNWFLMQSVTEAFSLLLHVFMVILNRQPMLHLPQRYLVIFFSLLYLLLLQLFDYLAKHQLMKGFGAVWQMCGGDDTLGRQMRLTHILLLVSCVLYIPFAASLFRNALRLSNVEAIAGSSVFIILVVQARLVLHARRTAALLAALSE